MFRRKMSLLPFTTAAMPENTGIRAHHDSYHGFRTENHEPDVFQI